MFNPRGHIVLDVEIARTVEQAGGWNRTDQMGVACCVVYEVERGLYRIYDEKDLPSLRKTLSVKDMGVTKITTFNGWQFDLPVIFGLTKEQWTLKPIIDHDRSDDILERIKAANNGSFSGWGLASVAKGMLGQEKIGDGKDMPVLFQEGYWGNVVTHCLRDVELTWRICQKIEQTGEARNAAGMVLKLPIQTEPGLIKGGETP